ncbi:PEPxxWA-CTERM sorting domain-containing protein [uncultured Sphingomonas sp.]|uniref:PEPxxWA-CTERM sorting domain-containing protein n=1 Tax=uncultured Sphingomonas sp. TaxID=158754 RepID=UPI0035CB90D6
MISKLKLLAVACAGVVFSASSAHAAFIVTYTQGTDGVTATGIGSLVTAGLSRDTSFDSFGPLNPFIQPAQRTQIVGGNGFQSYDITLTGSIPSGWGSGGQTNAASSSGGGVYLNDNGGTSFAILGVPIGYASGAAISNSAFYAGQTFASMGLTIGNYAYNYRAGANSDSFSLIVSSVPTAVPTPPVAPAVPEPATWAMMMLGMGVVGYSLRRRQAAARVAHAV